MQRFKDTNLTHEEWKAVFDFPKEFNIDEIVECGRVGVLGCNSMKMLWKVIEISPYKKGGDVAYRLKNLITGEIELFSSTFIWPLGTFVDDEILTM